MANETTTSISPFLDTSKVVTFNTPVKVIGVKFAGAGNYNVTAPGVPYTVYSVACDTNIYVNASGSANAAPPANTGINNDGKQSELNPGGARVIPASANGVISLYCASTANAVISFYSSGA